MRYNEDAIHLVMALACRYHNHHVDEAATDPVALRIVDCVWAKKADPKKAALRAARLRWSLKKNWWGLNVNGEKSPDKALKVPWGQGFF
jgi:hypothetical protein